jgi:hypothetical protein
MRAGSRLSERGTSETKPHNMQKADAGSPGIRSPYPDQLSETFVVFTGTA